MGKEINDEKYQSLEEIRIESKILNDPPNNYNKNRDFTSLEVWQKNRKVKLFFYSDIIRNLPQEEKYALGQQIRRAAISITANIAEGYGRFHYQEGLQFYRIAKGSLYELKDHLISCLDLDYISKDTLTKGFELIEEGKMLLNGFIKYTQSKL